MTSNRKDDHLHYARIQSEKIFNTSDFDYIHLIHQSIPKCNLADIDISTNYLGHTFNSPLFINAMTGGSENGKIINQKLAIIAKETNLPLALGSASITLKDSNTLDSFKVVKQENPDIFLIANLGIEHPIEHFHQIINTLEPNAFQIHINAMQELLMPEGSREFDNWLQNLDYIANNLDIPVIVKEVGFGMSMETLQTLKNIGVKTVDISGFGGTNFAEIENNRNNHPATDFNYWGISTPISLLECQDFLNDMTILASGGITTPIQAIKSLALGANAVGMAGFFLKELNHFKTDEIIKHVQQFELNLKKAMLCLDVKNLNELKQIPLVLDSKLENWCKQRKIILNNKKDNID